MELERPVESKMTMTLTLAKSEKDKLAARATATACGPRRASAHAATEAFQCFASRRCTEGSHTVCPSGSTTQCCSPLASR